MTNDNSKAKPNKPKAGPKPKNKRKSLPLGVRVIIKILRLLIFPVLCLIGLYAGLRIGYVQFGGGDPKDVLQLETWKHMLDLVFAES